MPKYLLLLSQSHLSFRKEELQALAHLAGLCYIDLSPIDEASPFAIVEIDNDTDAKKLVERSILARAIYAYYGESDGYEGLHEEIKLINDEVWLPYKTAAFRFDFECFCGTRTAREQVELINEFAHLPLGGPIRIKNPEVVFTILEQWRPAKRYGDPSEFVKVFFGRLVSRTSRHLVNHYSLKTRGYLGTTSMDAELSLVTANMALAAPGKLVYDPFVGTGSFLVTSSGFGATCLGSDIDGRQIKGKGKKNIHTNFEDYNLEHLLLDCLTCDIKHCPLREGVTVDAIIADPPYGE